MNIQKYGKANIKLINWIKQNRNKYIFILYTCRHNKELEEAIEYLQNKHNIVFNYVNENVSELIQKYGDTRKIYADYYIDDKNVDIKELLKL